MNLFDKDQIGWKFSLTAEITILGVVGCYSCMMSVTFEKETYFLRKIINWLDSHFGESKINKSDDHCWIERVKEICATI